MSEVAVKKDISQIMSMKDAVYLNNPPLVLTWNTDVNVPLLTDLGECLKHILHNTPGSPTKNKITGGMLDRPKGRRSLHDLMLLVKGHTGKEYKAEEILLKLLELRDKGEVRTYYCTGINRRVWMESGDLFGVEYYTMHIGREDEFGLLMGDYEEFYALHKQQLKAQNEVKAEAD